MRAILTIAVVLGLAGAGGYYYVRYVRTDGQTSFRTAKVERGEMLPTIGATGTIEPEEVVDIGAQVAGKIIELKVDYGTPVEKDAVLALIDPTKYKAAYEQSSASVALARANLEQAKATQHKTERDEKRAADLLKTNAIAQADYDSAEAAYLVAKANVGVAEASITAAEAQQRSVRTDLEYTTITSPEKGVIVDRRVNVGQTVVAALNTPSLFLLAKDLSRLQIWASVNEADIGRIKKGLKATFTVDAFPNKVFEGFVSQVRLNATMTQNVVTYTVVVTTENKDKDSWLLPYLTANLNFEIERHEDVLKVPNAALRYRPRPQLIAPDVQMAILTAVDRKGDRRKSRGAEDGGTAEKDKQPGPSDTAASPGEVLTGQATAPKTTGTGLKPEDWKERTEANARRNGKPADGAARGKVDVAAKAKKASTEHSPPGKSIAEKEVATKKQDFDTGFIWTIDDNYVRPVKVQIIATDGTMTEVREAPGGDPQGPKLNDGLEIVTGENVATEGDDTTNPFMPRLFRGRGGSAGGGGGGGGRGGAR